MGEHGQALRKRLVTRPSVIFGLKTDKNAVINIG